jgi:glycosyltransferase involved in cell wall biosynthesis
MLLVLNGSKGWWMDDFHKQIGELGFADSVIFAGYLSNEELIWLLQNDK